MQTELLSSAETKGIQRAAAIILSGGLVAIPTETVYGLAANALDEKAVLRIFEAKQRPSDNPLIIHISDESALDDYCTDIPENARILAKKYWPGPLTLVLKAASNIPNAVTAGLSTVAVRCPAHEAALALIRSANVPLAAPSANLSGTPSPTCAAHVLYDLDGRIDAVLDGGECGIGVESTIVDLSGTRPRILRPGGISSEELGIAYSPVSDSDCTAPIAPGMKYRHYAPAAALTVLSGSLDDAVGYVKRYAAKNSAVLCFDGEDEYFNTEYVLSYGSVGDYDALARNLYAALRKADSWELERIFVRCPTPEGLGYTVVNRLLKASGGNIIDTSEV